MLGGAPGGDRWGAGFVWVSELCFRNLRSFDMARGFAGVDEGCPVRVVERDGRRACGSPVVRSRVLGGRLGRVGLERP